MTSPRSLTGKKWSAAKADVSAKDIVEHIANARGLLGDGSLPDVGAFGDFSKARDMLRVAIAEKKVIGVFGDYDCDGITGVAQIARLLRRRGEEPVLRLPHRKDEGYGLKPAHIAELAKQGVQLLITVDTGVSCPEAMDAARERGMQTIIIDHHRMPAIPAKPDALLHPMLDMQGQNAHPSASGLCFAFVAAYEASEGNDAWEGYEEDLLLGTLGTIADLVPLLGVNRSLVRAGLAVIPHIQNPLAEFLTRANVGKGATARDLAFRVAPRINAAGRMSDPTIALRGLLGDVSALEELDALNVSRQEFVQELLEESLSSIDVTQPLIASMNEKYTPGVVGLVAGKLTEAHGRPSMIASIEGDTCTASLRSIPQYDITAGLTTIGELFVSFGGHAQAAGCTFTKSNYQKIVEGLNADIRSKLDPEDLVPELQIDAELDAKDVTSALCDALTKLEPFGQNNPEPRFVIKNATLAELKLCGAEKTHVQFRMGSVKAIGFRLGHIVPKMSPEERFDVACRLSINIWNGQRFPQIFVDDIRVAVAEKAELPIG